MTRDSKPTRRNVLLTGVSAHVFLAGCLDFSRSENGNGEITDTPDALLPEERLVTEVLDGEWEKAERESASVSVPADAHGVRGFARMDTAEQLSDVVDSDPRIESPGGVEVSVWTYEERTAAREGYEAHPDHDRGFTEADIGDESISGGTSPVDEYPQVRVLFRERNVVAWVSYWDVHVAEMDDTREYEANALDLAEAIRRDWLD